MCVCALEHLCPVRRPFCTSEEEMLYCLSVQYLNYIDRSEHHVILSPSVSGSRAERLAGHIFAGDGFVGDRFAGNKFAGDRFVVYESS